MDTKKAQRSLVSTIIRVSEAATPAAKQIGERIPSASRSMFDGRTMSSLGRTMDGAQIPNSLLRSEANSLRSQISMLRSLSGSTGPATALTFARALPALARAFSQAPATLSQAASKAFDGWRSQLTQVVDTDQQMQSYRALGTALLNSSLASNPQVQQLSQSLLKASEDWSRALPKIVQGLEPGNFLSNFPQLSPEGIGQQLGEKFGTDPLSFLRGLGATPSNLSSLAPDFANASTLYSLAQNGVDLNALGARLNPSEISQTVQSLAREGLNDSQIATTLSNLASGKSIDNALAGVKDLAGNLTPGSVADAVRSQLPDNINIAEGSVKVGGALLEVGGSYGKPGGPFYAEGHVAIGEASLALSGEVTASLKDLAIGAHGKIQSEINLIRAEGQISTDFVVGSLQAGARTQAGATALGEGTVMVRPLNGDLAGEINGEAFAGARAGGSISPTLGPVGATGGIEAQAGVGVNFHANAGFKNGKFSYAIDFGAALGLGFRIKFGYSIDFKKIGNYVKDAAVAIAKGIPFLAKKLAGGVSAVAGAIKNGVRSAVSWVGNGLGSVAKGLGSFAKNMAHFIGGAAKAVTHVAADAGKAVASAAKSVGKAISSVFSW